MFLKMPTHEESVAISKEWWDSNRLQAVSQDVYSEKLRKHCIPFEVLRPETIEDTQEFLGMFMADEFISAYAIDEMLSRSSIPSPWFWKLITRSPKDYATHPVINGQEIAIQALSSIRTYDDLVRLSLIPEKFAIIIKPWVEINKRDEFRAFIENRSVVGISQYHYNEAIYYTPIELDEKIRKMKPLLDVIIEEMPIDNFVCDLWISDDNPLLIETNPWGLSDPCMFKTYDAFNPKSMSFHFLARNFDIKIEKSVWRSM